MGDKGYRGVRDTVGGMLEGVRDIEGGYVGGCVERCPGGECSGLAFTRYCHYQYGMLNGKTRGCRESIYCAVLIAKYYGVGLR